MKNSIVLYPHLSKAQRTMMSCSLSYLRACYTDEGKECALKCDYESYEGSSNIGIVDDSGCWAPDKYDLTISGELSIDTPSCLFGKQRLVSEDSSLGIGYLLKSKMSNQRRAGSIGVISNSDGERVMPFSMNIPRATMRGNFEITFVIYLKSGLEEFGITPGAIMGELLSFNVVLEGMGSTFTVLEKSEVGAPLWTIECDDVDDPACTAFSDAVKVIINTAHPAWQLTADEKFRKELLKEIIASSMQIAISSLDPSQYDGNEDYEPGSVCDAVAYFVSRANLDIGSSAAMAQSIRKYLDKKMK